MATDFAFRAFGLSQNYSVGTAITTLSMVIVQQGGTTLSLGTAAYQPSVMRIENMGAALPYVALGGAASTTIAIGTGVAIGGLKTVYLRTQGTPYAVFISAGTTTLNLTYGEGGFSG